MLFFHKVHDICLKAKETLCTACQVKVLLIVAVILFGFFLRIDTFWLPHILGDQTHYLGLAMKLDNMGFHKGYNLRGIDQVVVNFDEEGRVKIVVFRPSFDPYSKGDLLNILSLFGVNYFDQPFFHKPPGFPYLLMLSHKIFAEKNQPYSAVVSNLRSNCLKIRPALFMKTQFYAVIVPLFFGLGAIFFTFALGSRLFNYRAGLYAAFIYSLNPVAILMDQRLLADSMVVFFTVLSVYFFVIALEEDVNWFYFFSGLSCGSAVLGKQSGGYILISVLIYTVLSHKYRIWDIKKLLLVFLSKAYVLTALGCFIVCGFWFVKIYSLFGNPLWQARQTMGPGAGGPWADLLTGRPAGWILYMIGIPCMSPLLAVSYISLKKFVAESWNMLHKKAFDYRFVFIWIVIFVFYFMLRHGMEHRRMLPVYPFLAVIAGYYYDRFIRYPGKLPGYFNKRYFREALVAVFFTVSAVWMVYIAKKALWAGSQVIGVPF